MDIRTKLNEDLKAAMKSGDTVRRETVRLLRGAVRNKEIDAGKPLTDAEILDVIAKQAKQRRDSIEQYRAANRDDLVAEEQAELEIIEAYLPRQLSDAEITERATAVIAELGVSDMKGMGKVMQRLSQDLKGVADGKRISKIVRELLG